MQGTGHVGTSATRRTLWALLWCSIVALLFPAALALGVVVHLDLALTRAATRQIVHAVLAGRFHGSLVVGPIVELTLSRVEIDGVLALAPDGTEVLAAERVVADGGLAVVLASLRSSRAERLHLPVVEIDAVRVDLARGDDGVLLLARAFEPVRPPPELPPPQPPAPSRFVLTLPALRVGEITVRGPLGGTELEARVRGLSASLRVAHEEVTLALDRTEVELDRPVPLRVTVQGHARLTPTGPDAWARLEGALADIRMAATASIAEGHRVALALDVPSITPDTLRRLVGEHPLRATAGAAARVEGSLREGLAVHARGRLDNGTQAQGSIRLTGRVDLAGPTPLAYARLDVSEVNLAAVHTLPATSLGATVWAWGVVDGAGSRLGLRLSTEPTTVAGQHLPGLAGEAQIDPEGAELALQAREPGASVLVSARYRRGQPAGYGLLLDLPALQSVPRLLELLTPAHPAAALAGGARLRSDGLVRPAPAAGTDDVDLGWEVSVDRAR